MLKSLHGIAIHGAKRLQSCTSSGTTQGQCLTARHRPGKTTRHQRGGAGHKHAGSLIHPLAGGQRLRGCAEGLRIFRQATVHRQRIITERRGKSRDALPDTNRALPDSE